MIPDGMAQQAAQQAAAFRQNTGGVAATVYIDRAGDEFRVVVRTAEGSPLDASALAGALIEAVGVCCQQLGMEVKV